MENETIRKAALNALREARQIAASGDGAPELVVIPEGVLRRCFGDDAVDAAFANGTASYLTEDDEV